MKRMKKKIKTNDGFTLMELMVALLIMSILLGAAGSVFFVAMKVYTRGENISYKEGSITNVETALQNALSIAKATGVKIITDPTQPSSDYSIGFKNGVCVEIIDGVEYKMDQISSITFTVVNVNTMVYEITPKDATMSKLKGGIVMNNVKVSPLGSSVTFNGGTNYLDITYETGT